jgi:hypothetical protein
MVWDLGKLRAEVHAAHGSEQLRLLKPCIDSVSERIAFAIYHYREAKRLMEPFASKVEESEIAALNLLLGGQVDGLEADFQTNRAHAAAHIVACLQSVHSLADILAHVIYIALGTNLDLTRKPLQERQIDATHVNDRLPPGAIKLAFEGLVKHKDFVYLEACVNRSKHRSVIPVPYSILTDQSKLPWHGLKLSGFERLGVSFPDRWALVFLRDEIDRQQRLIGDDLGPALNAGIA